MPDSANGDAVGLDVFRQRHPDVSRITQVMQIRARHFAQQSKVANRFDACSFLRGPNRGHGHGTRLTLQPHFETEQ